MGRKRDRVDRDRHGGVDRQARTFGERGTVQMMNSAPFQWKPSGITRGVPSRAVYATRAGMLELINSCASGSFRTRMTWSCCIVVLLVCAYVWS